MGKKHLENPGRLTARAKQTLSEAYASLTPADRFRLIVPEVFDVPTPQQSHFPAIVIGSGFGGAVTALRLAEKGIKTAVLERGSRWPISSWRETFSSNVLSDGRGYWYRDRVENIPQIITCLDPFGGVLDLTDYKNILVMRGAAVGGGSIVYTGASIQPKRSYFDTIFNGIVDFDEMNDVYYPRVREMLKVDPIPEDVYQSGPFGHCRVWEEQSREAGYDTWHNDSVFNWDVIRAEDRLFNRRSATVGESNLGNSNGAKFDLTQNYLKYAEETGNVQIYPGHEVRRVIYDGERYQIHVDKRYPDSSEPADSYVLTCDYLFLGAGSIGSSEILVRAKANGDIPGLNEHIGEGWGTNGDTIAIRSGGEIEGLTQASPIVVGLHDDSQSIPVTLENWFLPKLGVNIGANISLGMAFDMKNRGKFVYNEELDRADLDWPENGNDEAVAVARAVNDRVAESSSTVPGVILPNVLDIIGFGTAHPLGGLVIGKATDAYGRVLGANRLYVMDGALIPGTTGSVNPSLTITALAERNIETILKEDFT